MNLHALPLGIGKDVPRLDVFSVWVLGVEEGLWKKRVLLMVRILRQGSPPPPGSAGNESCARRVHRQFVIVCYTNIERQLAC